MDFGQFLGNDTLKAQLSAAIDAQRLTHCYLLSGPKGSGKRTLAQLLMAAMECTADQRPCGRCSQCRKALQGIHPDIAVVDDTSRKTIPVDLIRQVCSDAYIRPNEGRRKIYLLPRAQDLGLPGQNALLKILEEPPEAVTFLLLCENADRLLPTIRSRCVELKLVPLPEALLLQALQTRYPDRPQADLQAACRRSGGFLGQAQALLEDQAALPPQTLTFAEAFAQGDRLQLLELLVKLEKAQRDDFCQLLLQWRALLVQALQAQSGIDTPLAQSREIARRRTMAELSQAIAQLSKAAEACQANVGVGHLCGMLSATLL